MWCVTRDVCMLASVGLCRKTAPHRPGRSTTEGVLYSHVVSSVSGRVWMRIAGMSVRCSGPTLCHHSSSSRFALQWHIQMTTCHDFGLAKKSNLYMPLANTCDSVHTHTVGVCHVSNNLCVKRAVEQKHVRQSQHGHAFMQCAL